MLIEAQNISRWYKSAIKNFKYAYLKLGIPVSVKVHIVFEHIIQFYKNVTRD